MCDCVFRANCQNCAFLIFSVKVRFEAIPYWIPVWSLFNIKSCLKFCNSSIIFDLNLLKFSSNSTLFKKFLSKTFFYFFATYFNFFLKLSITLILALNSSPYSLALIFSHNWISLPWMGFILDVKLIITIFVNPWNFLLFCFPVWYIFHN